MKDINASIQTIEERVNLDKQRAAMQRLMELQKKKEDIEKRIIEFTGKKIVLKKEAKEESDDVKKQQILLKVAHVGEEVKCLQKMLDEINAELAEYDNLEDGVRYFNKYVCFSNIRELLKENQVKIGQIEKDAGCQPGYMSRLDKPSNTSDPSIEFIVTAAKSLGVSLDSLVFTDMAELTPTEKYLVTFFDKLKADTLEDKLDWNRESADSLNRMETDMNGNVYHPLFSYETFYEQTECEYPEEVSRVVFVSKSFGPGTSIEDDCFNLKMKNGSCLYLMDICKSVHRVGDPSAFAKEIWMYTPGSGSHLLLSNKDVTPLAPLVNTVFATVKERMKHPKLKKELQSVINAFLQDDIGDDDDDTPFF